MRVLLLGSQDIAGGLAGAGCQVMGLGPEVLWDEPAWEDIAALGSVREFRPELVVVCDHIGGRVVVRGMWRAGVKSVFWGLDSPLNRFWQFDYALGFDVALVDQPAQARELGELHPGAGWLGVGVDPALYPAPDGAVRKRGVCFVGVVNEGLRPKRSAVLRRVEAVAPVVVVGGRGRRWVGPAEAARMYQSWQVSLNENLFPGLCTRPLEVMVSGGVLLSEATGGVMEGLFAEGRELVFYDATSLEQKLELLLGDESLRKELAARGREAVLGGHTFAHRARQLLEAAGGRGGRRGEQEARVGEAWAMMMMGLRWPHRRGRQRVARAVEEFKRLLQVAPGWKVGVALAVAGEEQGLKLMLEYAGQDPVRLLRVAIAAVGMGQVGLARDVVGRLGEGWGLPGEAGFHLRAARVLAQAGEDLEGGFDTSRAHPLLWKALEHLKMVVRLEPGAGEAWEEMGRLLLRRGAATEAYWCLERALALGRAVEALVSRAKAEGYL